MPSVLQESVSTKALCAQWFRNEVIIDSYIDWTSWQRLPQALAVVTYDRCVGTVDPKLSQWSEIRTLNIEQQVHQ